MTVISRDSLTHDQHVALSNTICGDPERVGELEQMGLVTSVTFERRSRGLLAFFELTKSGDEFVDRHYVVQLP